MKIVRLLNESGNKVTVRVKNKNLEEAEPKTGAVIKIKGLVIDTTKNNTTQELLLTKIEAQALLGVLLLSYLNSVAILFLVFLK
jgi:hypothetical protein